MVSNSLASAAWSRTVLWTTRREASVFSRALVITRSTSRRASLALGVVVRMLSLRITARTRLSSSALRWLVFRLSLRPALAWRDIAVSLLLQDGGLRRGRLGRPVLQLHAQAEPHLGEDFLDLLQRLAAEVLGLQHLRLRLLHQVADGLDVGVLQAIRRTHRQLQLVDRAEEVLVQLLLVLRQLDRSRLLRLVEVDEDGELLLDDLRRERHCIRRRHRAVAPHLEREPVVVGGLPDAGVGHLVVDLLHRAAERR